LQMKDRIHVYFTISLSDSDIKKFVNLIFNVAHDKATKPQSFVNIIFNTLLNHAFSKFNKRFDTMKTNILRAMRDGDLMPSTNADLERFLTSLENKIDIQFKNGTDTEAASYSVDDSVCKEMKLALSTIRSHVLTDQTLDFYEQQTFSLVLGSGK
jgi:hypothetical protein